MLGRGLKLFRLFGFQVKVDASWLIIAVLVSFTLARGLFPSWYKGLNPSTYWWMGIAGALGLFASIIFHEFFHSVVARQYGLPMKGITLFIFGGIAEMDEQPPSPKIEFLMALAGPLSSIVLGFVFYAAALLLKPGFPAAISGVVAYLAYINFILAMFNLIPAFPMDGGRILRAALWKWKGNVGWATGIASSIGGGFGLFLILMGILSLFQGNPIGGIWLFLIGMFIRSASQMSYKQVLLHKMLEGETVERFLKGDPVSVPPSASVSQLLEDYFFKYHYKMFPVAEEDKLSGCITMERVKGVPRELRDRTRVEELVQKCSLENTVPRTMDALKALRLMDKSGNDKLMVVDDDRLAGIVTRNDILRFFAVKMELEEFERKP